MDWDRRAFPEMRWQQAGCWMISAVFTCVLAVQPAAVAQTVAESSPSAISILNKVINREGRISSFTCTLTIQFRKSSFPYISKTVHGTAYFGPLARFAVEFRDVPSLLAGFPGAYTAMMNISRWDRGFQITMEAPQALSGHTDSVLHLTSRDTTSSLRFGRVFVNRSTWTIEAMEWHFQGMEFDITQTFRPFGTYLVLAQQIATIRVPIGRAGAKATFQNYRKNVALSRRRFSEDP
jgi:hypothetical protein